MDDGQKLICKSARPFHLPYGLGSFGFEPCAHSNLEELKKSPRGNSMAMQVARTV